MFQKNVMARGQSAFALPTKYADEIFLILDCLDKILVHLNDSI